MRITLPYPDRRLSPNELERFFRMLLTHPEKARGAYFLWEKRVKEARYTGEMLARSVFVPGEDTPLTGNLRLSICYHPPDRRKRDQDGAHSAMKHTLDGVCRGLQIDDNQFKETRIEWGEVIPGGQVVMIVEEL